MTPKLLDKVHMSFILFLYISDIAASIKYTKHLFIWRLKQLFYFDVNILYIFFLRPLIFNREEYGKITKQNYKIFSICVLVSVIKIIIVVVGAPLFDLHIKAHHVWQFGQLTYMKRIEIAIATQNTAT